MKRHNFSISIRGEFITLRRVWVGDASDIYKWRTSKAAQYLNQPEGYSKEMQVRWIRARTNNEINYIIYPNESLEKVGMVSILNCDYQNLVCEVGRLLLDEKYINSSTPYGVEALKITYDYVFNVMGFRKISGTILGRNDRVYNLQTYLGMKREGYFERHVILRGKEEDLYFLSLFSEDFPQYRDNIDGILNKFRNK